MFKIDSSYIKKSFKYYIIFIFIGLVVISIGIFLMFSGNKKQKEFDSTTTATNIEKNCENKTEVNIGEGGTSVNHSNLCHPTYTFEVEGKEYTCQSSTGVSKILLKDNKNKVFYDSKNPENCMTEADTASQPFFYMIMIGLGSLFLLIGIFQLIKGTSRIKAIDKLKQIGILFKNLPYELKAGNLQVGNRKTMCTVVNVPLPNNTTIKLKGDSRFDFDSSKKYIDVLVDLNNPKKNFFIDYDIEYTGDDPNRVIDLNPETKKEEPPKEEQPVSEKPKMPIDPILEEKTIAIPTIAAGAVPIPLKTEPEPPSSGTPSIVNAFSSNNATPTSNEPVSADMLEPAVLIPGVNSPEEASVQQAPANETTPNQIGDEPAVIIPGVNDGTEPAPAPVAEPAPVAVTPTPVPQAPVAQPVATPVAAPVAEPAAPVPEPVQPQPTVEQPVQQPVQAQPVLGPVAPAPTKGEEVIPVVPVLGPDEPISKDDLPSWAEKGN